MNDDSPAAQPAPDAAPPPSERPLYEAELAVGADAEAADAADSDVEAMEARMTEMESIMTERERILGERESALAEREALLARIKEVMEEKRKLLKTIKKPATPKPAAADLKNLLRDKKRRK